ncbi:TEuncharacterized [Mya arenaria]|uniref:TEuncharacterized n=1 Tax=Mya arenaria TaxID=6604 RepID=A0ABY7FBG7_MYAAR|nr:TEuncharacterized [Mya arenaria]
MARNSLLNVFIVLCLLKVFLTDSQTVTPGSCNAPLTSSLRDDQFTASSHYSDGKHNATAARFNSVGWIASSSATQQPYEYLQVDFDVTMQLTSLNFTGANNGWYPRCRTATMEYSGDLTQGGCPRTARRLAVNVVERSGYSSLRMELFGCQATSQVPFRAGTVVNQDIQVDTTWIPNQNPFIIDRHLIVRPGVTLTLQAGVNVVFKSAEVGIDVFGTLVTEGLTGLRTVFSSTFPVIARPSMWPGMSQGAGGNITLRYSLVRQAVHGISGNGSHIRLMNTEVHSCTAGIRLAGGVGESHAQPILFDISVHTNEYGIQLHGNVEAPTVYIENSNVDRNSRSGITVSNWASVDPSMISTNFIMSNSSANNNSDYGLQETLKLPINISVHESSFIGNDDGGIYFYHYYPYTYTDAYKVVLNVTSSVFTDSGFGIYSYCYRCYLYKYALKNNSFSRLQQSVYMYAVDLDGQHRETATIANNVFTLNTKDLHIDNWKGNVSVTRNSFEGSYETVRIQDSSGLDTSAVAVVSGNTFKQLTWSRSTFGIYIQNVRGKLLNNTFLNCSSSTLVNLANRYDHEVRFNRFINTSSVSCFLHTDEKYNHSKMLIADQNYWDTADITRVKSKVCDFFLNSEKSIISINSIYNGADLTTLVHTPNLDSFIYTWDLGMNAFVVGGVISTVASIPTLTDIDVVVNRSVIVLPGAQITMTGVAVNFTDDRGVIVRGNMKIESSSNRISIFRRHLKNDWNGIKLFDTDFIAINTEFSGAVSAISIEGNVSFICTNCSTGVAQITRFIYAYEHYGYANVSLVQCNLSANSQIVQMSTGAFSSIKIYVIDSILQSSQNVVDLQERSSDSKAHAVEVAIQKSNLFSSGYDVINIRGCAYVLNFTLKQSVVSSTRYRNIIYLNVPSIDLEASGNNFVDFSNAIYIYFCKALSDKDIPLNSTINNLINIEANTFNSTNPGSDIYLYSYYGYERNHTIEIRKNVVNPTVPVQRKFLQTFLQYQYAHTLLLSSNTISKLLDTVLDISTRFIEVNITNNTFSNNLVCILYRGTPWRYFKGLNILNNNYINNSAADGIVQIQAENFWDSRVELSYNNFENNTETVITIQTVNISMAFNFFENPNAKFNLKANAIASYAAKNVIVNASLNFWGSDDPKEIEKTLFDADYDDTLLDVIYRPYLGSKNISDIQNREISFISGNRIGGLVEGNVTLVLTGSPYTVVSNIEVGTNDTLEIEAGVVLRFKSDIGIIVYGQMDVLGSPEAFIVMDMDAFESPWRGIDFSASEKESRVQYLIVNNTKEGIKTTSFTFLKNVTSLNSDSSGIQISLTDSLSSTLSTTASELTAVNCSRGIVIVGQPTNMSSLTITSCMVLNNSLYGIEVETSGNVTLNSCIIKNNTMSGLKLNMQKYGRLSLHKCDVKNNSKRAIEGTVTGGLSIDKCNISDHIIGYYNYWRNWVTDKFIDILVNCQLGESFVFITNSLFLNNIADGIQLKTSYYNYANVLVIVNDNTFSKGNKTFRYQNENYYRKRTWNTIRFMNNVIEENVIPLSNSNNDVLNEFILVDQDELFIDKNTFVRNRGRSAFAINTVYLGHIINMTFTGNTFFDNDFTFTTVDVRSQAIANIHRNVFEHFGQQICTLRAPAFDINYKMNATHNFWGTDNFTNISESVCGYEKDMGLSFVSYIPFYTDGRLKTLSTPDNFNSVVNGGEITTTVTLSTRDHPKPILISRSILIRPMGSLFIEEGVTLRFEEKRGIYVQGSLKCSGTTLPVRLESSSYRYAWVGLFVNSTSILEQDRTRLIHTIIKDTQNGIVAYTQNLEFTKGTISNSATNCLLLYPSITRLTIYDFEGAILENCTQKAVFVNGIGKTALMNVNIKNSKTGIYVAGAEGSIDVRSSNISLIHDVGVEIQFTSRYAAGNVTFENNMISKAFRGLVINVKNDRTVNTITVSRNSIDDAHKDALYIRFPTYRSYYVYDGQRSVEIALNTFHNSCGISIETWNNANLTFNNNIIRDAVSVDSECLFKGLALGDGRHTGTRRFDISTNAFENITAKCIVYLEDDDNANLKGEFLYNQITETHTAETTVLTRAYFINISQNIFDNPLSAFDVKTTLEGSRILNATENWWGSSDAAIAYNRIYDQRRDPGLVFFDVDPVVTTLTLDCSNVNNCSQKGWTGPSCTEYDCVGVNNCYGNGKCVGPNVCECNEGWSGSLCIFASCKNVLDCSGRGFCTQPDICSCSQAFTGVDCGSCVPLHWGHCDCEDDNWSGYLCDRCSEAFYGPDCLPLIKVLDIVPNQGLDKGGNSVHVWGHNFPETANHIYYCKFGITIANGTWIAWNHVVCVSPQNTEGSVMLEISPNGSKYTHDKLTFNYYATCPPGSCGRDLEPSHGQCLFGGCTCFLPWVGDTCSKELLSPTIFDQDHQQTVEESMKYFLQLNLMKGDPPVRWSLLEGPQGMTIDERTGMISWLTPLARSQSYRIRARATNTIGSDTKSWELAVPFSYTAEVETSEPSGTLASPRPVQIQGRVLFSREDNHRMVPVDLEVTEVQTGRKVVIHEWSNPFSPQFFLATHFPRADDAGQYVAVARHPGASRNPNASVHWSVLGIRCEPASVIVDEKILNEDGSVVVQNVSRLVNIGNYPITNISSMVDGMPNAFVRRYTNSSSNLNIETLQPGERLSFDLVVKDARPLYGTIFVKFSTPERTSTRLRLSIRLTILKPLLTFLPNSLNENIVQGTQKIFDVRITNEGEVTASNVVLSLPNDARISIVSFANINATTDGVEGESLTISPGHSAQLTLSVIIGGNEALGEMSGVIYLNSDLTSTPLRYRFYITSIQQFNLTFTVKDEYTYFAADSPLVSNGKVTLVNPRRGYFETRYTTNETGFVVFENIYEDVYTLRAEAEGHAYYSEVILASADQTQLDIFLQRIAVKYTWSVEPTTVQDVYIIQLESTFETNVPMPVVTIEPAKVNTIPYELEEQEIINFNITNHGLIRADNVRFTVPQNHPYLDFELTVDDIGSVAANTSIIVPVRATLKKRVKRNFVADFVCGLAVLYDYICGGTQTRGLDVTLTREYPGRPPLPCGLGGGGGSGGGGGGGGGDSGGSSGTGSGSAVSYNPTTPLSCNCAKTLIKSCALAFHPIAGCALAISDLASADSILDGIVPAFDTTMACVSPFICPLCGPIYTAVRCLIDVVRDCNSARRRREISSSIVDNLMETAKPVDNFFNIIAEVLGDDAMYDLNTTWYQTFKQTLSDDSDLGIGLSSPEFASILNKITEEASKAILTRFLHRWNNTAAAWVNGTLSELSDTSTVINLSRLQPHFEQYRLDLGAAKSKGFNSIFDDFDYASNAYRTAEKQESQTSGGEKNDGVCARVRVRIIQELVLTRDAFNARLEIENGESSDLERIHVEIEIRQTYGTGELLIDNFSIGSPTLVGITDVDGTGRLSKDMSGSAEWLIIPYSSAAPEDDIQYDIGGRLSYSVGGSDFSVPLLPDTITVKPNPSLIVHYFHEKYVRGDDPLTPETEPIVPFSLAVMVMNNGFGVARALKITSGQPEIIENEKGLLITFKIIGAQLGDKSITSSLTVDFGDISSMTTKTARWLLTTTLMGTFYNFTATFENINPLGDPQLSLMDELGYHELIHLVRIENVHKDDGLDDFLVNDLADEDGIPDRLYNSNDGEDVAEVEKANATDYSVKEFVRSGTKIYRNLTFSVQANASVYFYLRFENTFSDSPLLYAEISKEKRALLVDKNVWLTSHILDMELIHLLDIVEINTTDVVSSNYTLTFGPRNMYAPRFNSSVYSTTISRRLSKGTAIVTIHAYDIDKDDFDMYIDTYNVSSFVIEKISQTSYELKIADELVTGFYTIPVVVRDHGIPALVSAMNASIEVNDADVTGTTHVRSSTTTLSSDLTKSTSFTSNTPEMTSNVLNQSSTTAAPMTVSTTANSNTTGSTIETTAVQSMSTANHSAVANVTSATTSSTNSQMTVSSTPSTHTTGSTLKTSAVQSTSTDNHSSFTNVTSAITSSSVTSTVSDSSKGSISPTIKIITSPVTKTTEETDVGESEELATWVIPTAIGGAVFVVIVLFIIVFAYTLRKKSDHGDYRM